MSPMATVNVAGFLNGIVLRLRGSRDHSAGFAQLKK